MCCARTSSFFDASSWRTIHEDIFCTATDTADAELHLTQAAAGNGMITNNSFDANTGRLLNICATTDSGACDGNVANLSYAWDTVGNLTQRQDTVEGTTENFCYDMLNRMFESNFGAACTGSGRKFVNYGNGGTITRRTDLCAASGCMTYGSGAGPHALTGITGTVNGFVNPTFTYDNNGNMTAGLGRSMTWTTFNMALTIAQGTTTLGYLYDAEHNRYKQCVGGCTSSTSTTLYLNGPGNEEKVTTGSSVTWRDYIAAAGQIVAERFNTSGTITTRYFVADHLGSTAVLTDETGAVVERDFYDAWGKQVTSTGAADTTCSLPPASQTTRGFTTQEHVDPVCLENFNARMYDPQLGRFLSADSMIPDLANGQAFDRYAYTYNNLLNATDPSGHATDPMEGMPCWLCSGEGWTTGSDGSPVAAVTKSAGSETFQNPDGSTTTIEGQFGYLKGLLAGRGYLLSDFASFDQYGGYLNLPPGFSDETGNVSTTGAPTDGDVPEEIDVTGGGFVPWDRILGLGTFAGGVGVLSSVVQYGSGTAAIGTNLRFYAKIRGNQYFRSFGIAKGAEALGGGLAIVSGLVDAGDYFFGNPNDPDTISGAHLSANLAMDAIGFAGPVGAGIAGGYYFFESGAADLYGQQVLDNQAIDPNYLPMDPMKISFHPKQQAPDVTPGYKKQKKRDDVIAPDDFSINSGKI